MNKRDLIVIIISTLTAIGIWIYLDKAHSDAKTDIPSNYQQVLDPVDPNFSADGLQP